MLRQFFQELRKQLKTIYQIETVTAAVGLLPFVCKIIQNTLQLKQNCCSFLQTVSYMGKINVLDIYPDFTRTILLFIDQ